MIVFRVQSRLIGDLHPETSATLEGAANENDLGDAISSRHGGIRRVGNIIDEILRTDRQTDGRVSGKEMPLHQIKARSRARIFRDPRRNESRCPYDTGRREAEQLFHRNAPSFLGSIPDDLRRGSIWSTIKRTARSHPAPLLLASSRHAMSSSISVAAREGWRH